MFSSWRRPFTKTALAFMLLALPFIPRVASGQNSAIRGLARDTSPLSTDAFLVSKLGQSRDKYQLASDLLGVAFQSFTLNLPAQFSCAPSPATAAAGAATVTCSWTSTTIPLANLSLFGASGSGHAAGIVPDPGSSSGSTHYLREDATWAIPPAPVDATSSVKGILELTGDLGGSATAPTVVGLTHAGNYVASVATTAPVTGGAAGSNGAAPTIGLSVTPANAGGATALQGSFPGTQQTGSINISGTIGTGGYVAGYVAKTSAYTLTASDFYVECNAVGGAFTLTLPDATASGVKGQTYILKKTDSSANACTLATTSSQTVDGATPLALYYQGQFIGLYSDGSNWKIRAAPGSNGGGLGHYDPETVPASCVTGTSICETWPGNLAQLSPTWENQTSATETIEMEGATLTGHAGSGFQARALATPSAGAVDFTLTAQVDVQYNTGNGCGIGLVTAGTMGSPTTLYFAYFDSSGGTDWQTATSYAGAGLSNVASGMATSLPSQASVYSGCLQIRYTASSRAVTPYFSGAPCRQFIDSVSVSATITAASSPPAFFYFVRDAGVCNFRWYRARTDANRNQAGQ